MKYKSLMIFAFIAAISMLSVQIHADILDGFGDKPEEPKEKDVTDKKLPSFKLKNIADEELLLEDLREKKLAILMFSSKCPYSINSAKLMDELLKDNKDVTFLAICLDFDIGNLNDGGKTQKQVAEEFSKKCFTKSKNVNVLLADEEFRKDYSQFFNVSKLQKTPIHMFVDGDARVDTFIMGSSDKDELKAAIEGLSD